MERECDNCKYRDVYYKAPPCNECNGYQNWESDAMTNADKNECKVCANADNEYCFACDNGNQFKPMTNADRIRAMTDEELAEFMCHNVSNGTVNCAFCAAAEFCSMGHNGWLYWLKEEAKGDTDEDKA